MSSAKTKRQNKILELIALHEVETQEELASLLGRAGFSVTQATISRDIRELKLSKINGHDGRQKYTAMPSHQHEIGDKLSRVLKEGYVSSTEASHIAVVRTMPGMAMAVAAALDAMELPGLAGCIAGDDTILCAMRSDEDVRTLFDKIDAVVRGYSV